MECLEGSAKLVVCKPDDSEIEGGRSMSVTSEVASTTIISSPSLESVSDCWKAGSDGVLHATCVPTVNSTASVTSTYAGVASRLDIRDMKSSKAGAARFVVVSLGLLAGMLL